MNRSSYPNLLAQEALPRTQINISTVLAWNFLLPPHECVTFDRNIKIFDRITELVRQSPYPNIPTLTPATPTSEVHPALGYFAPSSRHQRMNLEAFSLSSNTNSFPSPGKRKREVRAAISEAFDKFASRQLLGAFQFHPPFQLRGARGMSRLLAPSEL